MNALTFDFRCVDLGESRKIVDWSRPRRAEVVFVPFRIFPFFEMIISCSGSHKREDAEPPKPASKGLFRLVQTVALTKTGRVWFELGYSPTYLF